MASCVRSQQYSRWGPVYLTEMKSLEKTAPGIYAEFQAGNFVIKGSKNLFNQVPPGDYADTFVASVFEYLRHTTTRVDVTFDRYLGQHSIKSSTRIKKKTAKRRPVRNFIQGPEVPLPQIWPQFIALEDNKADLATYLPTELL